MTTIATQQLIITITILKKFLLHSGKFWNNNYSFCTPICLLAKWNLAYSRWENSLSSYENYYQPLNYWLTEKRLFFKSLLQRSFFSFFTKTRLTSAIARIFQLVGLKKKKIIFSVKFDWPLKRVKKIYVLRRW